MKSEPSPPTAIAPSPPPTTSSQSSPSPPSRVSRNSSLARPASRGMSGIGTFSSPAVMRMSYSFQSSSACSASSSSITSPSTKNLGFQAIRISSPASPNASPYPVWMITLLSSLPKTNALSSATTQLDERLGRDGPLAPPSVSASSEAFSSTKIALSPLTKSRFSMTQSSKRLMLPSIILEKNSAANSTARNTGPSMASKTSSKPWAASTSRPGSCDSTIPSAILRTPR